MIVAGIEGPALVFPHPSPFPAGEGRHRRVSYLGFGSFRACFDSGYALTETISWLPLETTVPMHIFCKRENGVMRCGQA